VFQQEITFVDRYRFYHNKRSMIGEETRKKRNCNYEFVNDQRQKIYHTIDLINLILYIVYKEYNNKNNNIY